MVLSLRRKFECFSCLLKLQKLIGNQFSETKIFQTDGEGEFASSELKHLESSDILHQFSSPNTSQQNGVVDGNIIVETGLTLLFHAHVPHYLWVDAFAIVVCLININPTNVVNKRSHFQMLFHSESDYSSLKVFGCLYFPFINKNNE